MQSQAEVAHIDFGSSCSLLFKHTRCWELCSYSLSPARQVIALLCSAVGSKKGLSCIKRWQWVCIEKKKKKSAFCFEALRVLHRDAVHWVAWFCLMGICGEESDRASRNSQGGLMSDFTVLPLSERGVWAPGSQSLEQGGSFNIIWYLC